MPKIIDKRNDDKWRVLIPNDMCPHLTYPRSDIACEILENRKERYENTDGYCCLKSCPRREI